MKLLKLFTIVVATGLSVQYAYLAGAYAGYRAAGTSLAGICFPVIGNLCVYHADPYQILFDYILYLRWSLIAFVVFKVLSRYTIARVLGIFDLAVILFLMMTIREKKLELLTTSSDYLALIKETAYSETLSIGIVIVLLLLEALAWIIEKRTPAGSGVYSA
jgi:hypothetical protein